MMGTDYPENILPDDDGVSFLGSVKPVLSGGRYRVRESRRRADGWRRGGEALQAGGESEGERENAATSR